MSNSQDNRFQQENMCWVTYSAVRQAMGGKPYHMSLALFTEDAKEAKQAINQGIDAHLEACFVPDRGDDYDWDGNKLHCVVSVESLPVLLRRLFDNDPCSSLGASILMTLGFDEYGEQVGREALGLE